MSDSVDSVKIRSESESESESGKNHRVRPSPSPRVRVRVHSPAFNIENSNRCLLTFSKNLKSLNICSTLLHQVDIWPDSIEELMVSGNKLEEINGLNNLRVLFCSANRLISINIGSFKLQYIVCYENHELKKIAVKNNLVQIKNNRLIDGNILIEPIEYAESILNKSIPSKDKGHIVDVLNSISLYYINKKDPMYGLGVCI